MAYSRKYDAALKFLFSHPEMIRSLVQTFVSDKWVSNLDFSSITLMRNEHVSDQLNERRSDLVWKIRSNKEWLYLILLLEFQSKNDKFMPVRILSYGALIYEDLIKNEKKSLPNGKLPPIFPILFYTGASKWNVPSQFRECLSEHIPKVLMDYQFESRYLVLDIGRISISNQSITGESLIYSLIEIERAKSLQEVNLAIKKAYYQLKSQGDSLKRAFLLYSMRALKVQNKFPTAELEQLSEVSMLYERADKLWDDFAQENQQIGQQIGEEIGEKRGENKARKELVRKLLEKKFPHEFVLSLRSRLEQASADQLSLWLDEIIEEKFSTERTLKAEFEK